MVKSKGYWNSLENRIIAVKDLIVKLNKDPKEITYKDFLRNNLSGLLDYYDNSPYSVLKGAGLADFEPWEMVGGVPNGYFQDEAERIRAIKWLVAKIKKKPEEVTCINFNENNLSGLLSNHYNNSPYLALKEAELTKREDGTEIERWEMNVSKSYWKKKENRIKAIKWFIAKIKRKPQKIKAKDFIKYKLRRLLQYYNNSPYTALKEAGLADFEPWEMEKSPTDTFKFKKDRIRAVKWLVKETEKKPEEIKVKDFYDKGLRGLLARTEDSPYLALKEAGYDVHPKSWSKFNQDNDKQILNQMMETHFKRILRGEK